ncbi:hypothetical protein [uncultured Maribacter sp.]|uniref:hypothetical protein n=1 Tax=uncultured Maribacter sp. TaxID=431308 RepID=UPI00260F67EE|nr:hypothetical protein [uncultured Maribacter sp.]
MSYFTLKHHQKIVKLAAICFALGNIIFLLLLISKQDFVIGFGILFFCFFILSNAIAMFTILINMLTEPKKMQEHITVLFLLLFNWPIAGLYIYFISTV